MKTHVLGLPCISRTRHWSAQAEAGLDLITVGNSGCHDLTPALTADHTFTLSTQQLFTEIAEAQALKLPVKAVLIGPITYLWRGQCAGEPFDKLDLLERLLPVYAQTLQKLADLGVSWVQIDEPVLSLDLPQVWQSALELAYHRLQRRDINLLIATYLHPLAANLWLTCHLPVAGLHIDGVGAAHEIRTVVDQLPEYKVLSLGIIDSHETQHSDLAGLFAVIKPAHDRLGNRLWLSTNSLLHVPTLATQKLNELVELKQTLLQACS